MQKLKYLLIVVFTVFGASFIVWQQSQELWRGVSSYVVQNQADFLKNQISKFTEQNIKRMQSQINKVILQENSAQRINPAMVGISDAFRDSQFDGLVLLAPKNGEHKPLWKVMQPGVQSQWSEYFFDKTWRKALAETQKFNQFSWIYSKDPKQKGFWTVSYKVSIPEISTTELVAVAIVPKLALIDFSIALKAGVGEFVLVNSDKVTLVHSNGEYAGGTVVFDDLKEAHYSMARAPIQKIVRSGNDHKEMLLNFVPLKFTNLNLILASPVQINSKFIEGLISSVFLYFLFLLIISSALVLVFPVPFKEKYQRLIASMKSIVDGHFQLNDSMAREIPEAITALQEIDKNYAVVAVGEGGQDKPPAVNDSPTESQDVESTQEVELSEFEKTEKIKKDYFEIDEDDLSTEILNQEKVVSQNATPPPIEAAKIVTAKVETTKAESDMRALVDSILFELSEVIAESAAVVTVQGFFESVHSEDLLSRIKLPVKSVVANAIEAVQGTDDKSVIISGDFQAGVYTIKVLDSGAGVVADQIEKVFDPFYTTKDSSQHPGLGLTAAKNQFKDLKGEIKFLSGDKGSQVVMVIPVHNEKAATTSTLSKNTILNEPIPMHIDMDAEDEYADEDELPDLMMASPEGLKSEVKLETFQVTNNIDFPELPAEDEEDDFGFFQVKPANKIKD